MPQKPTTNLNEKSRTGGKYDGSQMWPGVVIGAVNPDPGRVLPMTADPRWQKRRLKIFERDGFCCQRCYTEEKQLEVHHLAYRKGVPYWKYLDTELITLCRDCHQYETDNMGKAMLLFEYRIRTAGLLSDEIIELAQYHYERRRGK